jgi:hypothetical protein
MASGRVPLALKQLKQSGVRFNLGTDMGGGGPGYYGLSSHVEMESLVKAGLTPSEAIVAATRNSAEILGVENLGTVTAGKSADFIVLDANPLDNIANTRRIHQLISAVSSSIVRGLRRWSGALQPAYRRSTTGRISGRHDVGAVTSASTDADGNCMLRRAEPPILKPSAGEFVRSLGDMLIGAAHGIRVDPRVHLAPMSAATLLQVQCGGEGADDAG